MSLLNKSQLLVLWEQTYYLSCKIEEFLNKNYSVEHIKDIIQEMKQINNKFMNDFSSEQYFNSIDPVHLLNYSISFKNFYESVGAISSCNAHMNPYEVMIPVKEIIQKLNNKHFLLTEPTWEINYSIGSLLSEDIKDYMKRQDFNITDNLSIIRIQFPTIHQDNVLLGAIMGHELGHYLDLHYKLNLSENILSAIMNKANLVELYKFITIDGREIPDTYKSDILKGILPKIVLKSWVCELVADVIGIVLYGIASHFSCEQIFMYGGFSNCKSELLDKFSDSHPRKYLRSTIRILALEELGYFDYLNKDITDYINEFHEGWQNAKTNDIASKYYVDTFGSFNIKFLISSESLLEIENLILPHNKEIVETVINSIDKLNNDIIYKSKSIKELVYPLMYKIGQAIPPNELHKKPVDSISIINAGWFAYLLQTDKIRENCNIRDSSDNTKEIRALINNLIRKALDSSNIHRRWLNATTK